jgi:hypothetical protein
MNPILPAARALLIATLIAAGGIASLPVAHGAVPNNARASPYGGSWSCVWGYHRE